MNNQLDDQITSIFQNIPSANDREVFAKQVKSIILQREAELLNEVKTILQTEIDDAKELEDNSIRIIIQGWLLNAQIQVAELERRHDG